MTADGPTYSRNIVRRRQVVGVVMMVCFVAPTASGWHLFHQIVLGERVTDPADTLSTLVRLAGLMAAILAGLLTCVLAGHFADRLHRSIWPEHPDEG